MNRTIQEREREQNDPAFMKRGTDGQLTALTLVVRNCKKTLPAMLQIETLYLAPSSPPHSSLKASQPGLRQFTKIVDHNINSKNAQKQRPPGPAPRPTGGRAAAASYLMGFLVYHFVGLGRQNHFCVFNVVLLRENLRTP